MTDDANIPTLSEMETRMQTRIDGAPKFNFDEMAALFKSDPDEFQRVTDQLRNDTIDYWADNTEEATRMKAKMFRQNQELRNVKHPLVRAEKAFSTMMDSFDELRGKLNELTVDGETEVLDSVSTNSNNVLPFKQQ